MYYWPLSMTNCCTKTRGVFLNEDLNLVTRLNYALSIIDEYIINNNKSICKSCREKVRDFVEEHLPHIDASIKYQRYTTAYNLPSNFDMSLLEVLVLNFKMRDLFEYGYDTFIGYLSKRLKLIFCDCYDVEDKIKCNDTVCLLGYMLNICSQNNKCFKCRGIICDFIANIENIQLFDSMVNDDHNSIQKQFIDRFQLMPLILCEDSNYTLFHLVTIYLKYNTNFTFIEFLYEQAYIGDYSNIISNIISNKYNKISIKLEKVLKYNDINEAMNMLKSFMYFDFENYYPKNNNMRERLGEFIMKNIDSSIVNSLMQGEDCCVLRPNGSVSELSIIYEDDTTHFVKFKRNKKLKSYTCSEDTSLYALGCGLVFALPMSSKNKMLVYFRRITSQKITKLFVGNNFECSICLTREHDRPHYLVALPCGHVFGKSCILLCEDNKCPTCRVEHKGVFIKLSCDVFEKEIE